MANTIRSTTCPIVRALLPALLALTASIAQAQPTEPAAAEPAVPPPSVVPNPEPAPTPPPEAPPAPVAPVVTESVALSPKEAEAAAVAEPPAPKELDARKSPMTMNAWLRLGATGQNFARPKRVDRLSGNGELDLLLNGQIVSMVGITANLVANFGNVTPTGTITGDVNVMDLIAKFDFDDAFHFWAGRMLVPSDRSNFSGPWFIAPWNYPGFFKAFAAPLGPRQGPNGRNDGATIWGQAGGGLFKYYAGLYDLWNSEASRPLLSGRISLSLLNPEPGYYGSSTFYGKDILGLGLGAQFQKAAIPGATDYGLINADLLFEKDLNGGGVIDIEGAIYKYFGDVNDYSYFALISYLTPVKIGPGALQPLVRLQQNKPVDGDSWTLVDAQLGYVVDTYACRFAIGYQYQSVDGVKGNQLFGGIQLQK